MGEASDEESDLAPEGESDEQQQNDDGEEGGSELEQLRAERDALRKRLADRDKADRDSKAAERRRKREKAIKDGKHDEVMKAERELREEAERDRDAYKSRVEAYEARQKLDNLAAKIVKQAKGGNTRAIARFLGTFDLELSDNPTKAEIKIAMDRVKDEAPELLGTTNTQSSNGRPPNRPGITTSSNGITAQPGTPEYYRQLGEHNSRQGTVPDSYAEATGRK